MIRKIIYVAILSCMFYCGYGQNVRLNVYANYVFDDRVESYYSSTSYFSALLRGGLMWGGGLEFMLKKDYSLELMYLRQDTKAPTDYWDYNLNRARHSDLAVGVNYILLGGNRYMYTGKKVEPYGGLMLGVAVINTKNNDADVSNSVTKFAWDIKLGVVIWASDNVGVKINTQLLSAVQAVGGTVYFGTGGGGAGVSSYSTMLQFALGGGLVFKFGGHENSQH